MGGFPITQQNLNGNTVLHAAIFAQDPTLLKLVILEKYEPRLLENPASLGDVKGNFRQGLTKCLAI